MLREARTFHQTASRPAPLKTGAVLDGERRFAKKILRVAMCGLEVIHNRCPQTSERSLRSERADERSWQYHRGRVSKMVLLERVGFGCYSVDRRRSIERKAPKA